MTRQSKKNGRNSARHRMGEITVGDISGGTGIAIGKGAQAIVHQSFNDMPDRITTAFRELEQALNAMSEGPHKEAAKSVVKTLEEEARKGNKADKTKIQNWMDFLAETAPDIWDVAIDTFINPVKGIGTVFKKIAEKAKAKQTSKESMAS